MTGACPANGDSHAIVTRGADALAGYDYSSMKKAPASEDELISLFLING
jgi:hypothetical protein